MLFNSYEFLFAFLPLAVCLFWWLNQSSRRWALAWITLASLVFYGWQTPFFLVLLIASLAVNFSIATAMASTRRGSWSRQSLLGVGLVLNLGVIGYFKYAFFFLQNVNALFETGLSAHQLVLPVGISFYTFQQIAYLVDRYRDEIDNYGFMDYCLFVTFFPQLIAGPIVHPKEMLPQLSDANLSPRADHFAVGLTIFFIGLFKKTVVADGLISFSGPAFLAAQNGTTLGIVEAWFAAIAYTLQLYFDFSGYSDMAIGLGRLFGIRLPLNFNSPYKAVNIIDFWRRWHMTLSRFLRDYIYFPLGGSRVGATRRYMNLMATMVLGGLWHGAGWTFVLWGAFHGLLLVVNHAWHAVKKWAGLESARSTWWTITLSHSLTFLAVTCGWVLFRATSLQAATSVFESMFGMNGIVLPMKCQMGANHVPGLTALLHSAGVQFAHSQVPLGLGDFIQLAVLLAVVWVAPNTQQIMSNWEPAYETLTDQDAPSPSSWTTWQPTPRWALFSSVVTVVAILQMSRATEFLYLQF